VRVPDDRRLDWDGCVHARDLGGLPTVDGRSTRRGAVVRSGTVDRLTPAGWTAVQEYGVRTIVDLRNEEELPGEPPHPPGIEVRHVPVDGSEDREFWDVWATGPQFGTPLYYGPWLERFPRRAAAVVRAIAQAPAGGVLFHCGRGRDRAGLVSLLLLALAGVSAEDIAADYALSLGDDADDRMLADYLTERGTSAQEEMVALATSLDAEASLRAGGLDEKDVAAVRARLLG
jgi:protein-tyrosine phosphatase